MGKFDRPSRCTYGIPVTFRWYGAPSASEGQDLEVALVKFQMVIEQPSRVTNGYIWAAARAEIKQKLELASQGKLTPPRQIDVIDGSNPPPLYEIRWQNITIQELQLDGTLIDLSLIVRMYHSEPFEAPHHFIGHHIHEKDISDPNTVKELQNSEISVARGYFEHGLPTFWGISSLTGRKGSINYNL